jgi:hypothetical protein
MDDQIVEVPIAAADWERFLRMTQEFAFPDDRTLLGKTLAHWSASKGRDSVTQGTVSFEGEKETQLFFA